MIEKEDVGVSEIIGISVAIGAAIASTDTLVAVGLKWTGVLTFSGGVVGEMFAWLQPERNNPIKIRWDIDLVKLIITTYMLPLSMR